MFFIHVFPSLEYFPNLNFECLVVQHLSTFTTKTVLSYTIRLPVLYIYKSRFPPKFILGEKQYSLNFWENSTFIANYSRDNISNYFSRDNISNNIFDYFSRDKSLTPLIFLISHMFFRIGNIICLKILILSYPIYRITSRSNYLPIQFPAH